MKDTIDSPSPSPAEKPTGKQRHPDANLSLSLGISSLITSLTPLGIALAWFGIVAANKAMKGYKKEPQLYTPNSYTRGKAGMICSISSLVIFVILAIYIILNPDSVMMHLISRQ